MDFDYLCLEFLSVFLSMAYYQRNGFLGNFPAVTRNLLIINLIVWIACNIFRNLELFLALFNLGSGYFRLYQLVTYMFTHVDFSHLFFNMFALYMFGATIENYWGQKRFLTYYMVTGIGAGLVQLLVLFLAGTPYPVPTIGASGAVFGLLLAFGMLFPNTPLYLMFIPIPIKAKYMVIGYGLIEFFFGIGRISGDNVAHFAHLGGMLFGIVLILYWRKKERSYYYGNGSAGSIFSIQKLKQLKDKLFRKKSKAPQPKRPESDWEYNARRAAESREIDRILDKIKESGYDSLTEPEKRQLFSAGKKQ
jgi:membrane associated rhomboid family serine protease